MSYRKLFVRFAYGFMCLGLLVSLSSCVGIKVSKDRAAQKAKEYISANILKEDFNAQVGSVEEQNGTYLVNIQIMKDGKVLREGPVHVSLDGKNLSMGPMYNMDLEPDFNKQVGAGEGKASNNIEDIPETDKPTVNLFVMSACPYGVQAEESFQPVAKALGDSIDFRPNYIVSVLEGGGNSCLELDGKSFCSLHGAEEASEDLRQICIWENQNDKWWSYIGEFNEACYKKRDLSEECSEKVAEKVGIDFDEVENCTEKSGAKLLSREAKMVEKFSAKGSPTIVINGVTYRGGRTPNDLLSAVCAGFKKQPAACNEKLAGGDEVAAPAASCATE